MGISSINTAIAMSAAKTDSMVESIISGAIDEQDRSIIEMYDKYITNNQTMQTMIERENVASVLGLGYSRNIQKIRDALVSRYNAIMRQIEKQKSYLSASMKNFLDQAAKLGVTEERISDILNEVSRKAQRDQGDKGAALVKMLEQATQEFAATSSDENMQKIVAHRDLLKRQSQIMNDIESARQNGDTDALNEAMKAFEQVKAEIAKFEASESDGSQITTGSKQKICNAVDKVLRFANTIELSQQKIDALVKQQIESFENWKYLDRWNFEVATSNIGSALRSLSDGLESTKEDRDLIIKLCAGGSVPPAPPPPPSLSAAPIRTEQELVKEMRIRFFAHTNIVSRFMCILQTAYDGKFDMPEIICSTSPDFAAKYKSFNEKFDSIQASIEPEDKAKIEEMRGIFNAFKTTCDNIPFFKYSATLKTLIDLDIRLLLESKNKLFSLLNSMRELTKNKDVRLLLEKYAKNHPEFMRSAKSLENEMLTTYRKLLGTLGIKRVFTLRQALSKDILKHSGEMNDFMYKRQQVLNDREQVSKLYHQDLILGIDVLYKMLMYSTERLLRTGSAEALKELQEVVEISDLTLKNAKSIKSLSGIECFNALCGFNDTLIKKDFLCHIRDIAKAVRDLIDKRYFSDPSSTKCIDDIIDNLQKLDCVLSTIDICKNNEQRAKAIADTLYTLNQLNGTFASTRDRVAELEDKKDGITKAIKQLQSLQTERIPDSIKPILTKIADAMQQNSADIEKLSFSSDDRSKRFSDIDSVKKMIAELITQVRVENISDIDTKQVHDLIKELIASLDLLSSPEHYQCSSMMEYTQTDGSQRFINGFRVRQKVYSNQESIPNDAFDKWIKDNFIEVIKVRYFAQLDRRLTSIQPSLWEKDSAWDILYSWPYYTGLWTNLPKQLKHGLSSISEHVASTHIADDENEVKNRSDDTKQCMFDLVFKGTKCNHNKANMRPARVFNMIAQQIESSYKNILEPMEDLSKVLDIANRIPNVNKKQMIQLTSNTINRQIADLSKFSNLPGLQYASEANNSISLDDVLGKAPQALFNMYCMIVLDIIMNNVDSIGSTPDLPLLFGWQSNKEVFSSKEVQDSINDLCTRLSEIAAHINKAQANYVEIDRDLCSELSKFNNFVMERYTKLIELCSKFSISK